MSRVELYRWRVRIGTLCKTARKVKTRSRSRRWTCWSRLECAWFVPCCCRQDYLRRTQTSRRTKFKLRRKKEKFWVRWSRRIHLFQKSALTLVGRRNISIAVWCGIRIPMLRLELISPGLCEITEIYPSASKGSFQRGIRMVIGKALILIIALKPIKEHFMNQRGLINSTMNIGTILTIHNLMVLGKISHSAKTYPYIMSITK